MIVSETVPQFLRVSEFPVDGTVSVMRLTILTRKLEKFIECAYDSSLLLESFVPLVELHVEQRNRIES